MQILNLLDHLMQCTKKLAIGEYRGILTSLDAVVHYCYEQCDIPPYIFSIRSRQYAGILLRLTTYIYDTKKYYVQEERNVTKSGHQYRTHQVVMYIPCM